MMVKVVCDECGKEFEKYHLYIRSDKNYCTRECFHAARKHNRRGYIVKNDIVIININKGKTVTVDLIDSIELFEKPFVSFAFYLLKLWVFSRYSCQVRRLMRYYVVAPCTISSDTQRSLFASCNFRIMALS